jgi:hypothetical protein
MLVRIPRECPTLGHPDNPDHHRVGSDSPDGVGHGNVRPVRHEHRAEFPRVVAEREIRVVRQGLFDLLKNKLIRLTK